MATNRSKGLSSPCQSHSLHHCLEPQDTQDPFEVVRQHIEAHFSTYVGQSARQEVRVAHPALERSEHMFNRTPPDHHGLG